MIKLYHTSQSEVRRPDIHMGRRNADFGPGFYLTPEKEFAYRWGREGETVNEYVLETSGLQIRCFERTAEWFEYIFHNRRGKDTLSADAVAGPIANDTIFDTLGIISSGFVSTGDALKLLQIGPAYRQVALKTEKAVSQLTWTGAFRIPKKDETILKKEREEYQQALSEVLKGIL